MINFHLALLLRRQLAKDGSQPRVHFHSTFFYNKLYRDQHEYNYKAVSRCVLYPRAPHSNSDTAVPHQVDVGEEAGLQRPEVPPDRRAGAPGTRPLFLVWWCMLVRKVRRESSPQEMHWVLAVIDLKKREVCYMDSLGGVDRMCQARAALCRLGRGCAPCMATASI